MKRTVNISFDNDYTLYQLHKRTWLRKIARHWYLSRIGRHATGPAIDFGCGIGTLLAMLPQGSIGLEINETTVDYCKDNGLDVQHYDPSKDKYQFAFITPNSFGTFIMSNVLEHIADAETVFSTILESCSRLGIDKVILVVPGRRGFEFDSTHRTFIDHGWLSSRHLLETTSYHAVKEYYFPINCKWIGNIYTYHELHVIFQKNSLGRASRNH
jgi:SAM-dependent methyltransferase